MSNPDILLKLKTTVETYEKELRDNFNEFTEIVVSINKTKDYNKINVATERQNKIHDTMMKLIVTYREYTRE